LGFSINSYVSVKTNKSQLNKDNELAAKIEMMNFNPKPTNLNKPLTLNLNLRMNFIINPKQTQTAI
jgi:hypothetical protein